MPIRGVAFLLILLVFQTNAAAVEVNDILAVMQYADLVVEGEVSGISRVTVPSRDFFMSVPHGPDLSMALIEFSVKKVLIGDWDAESVPVAGFVSFAGEYHFDLEEGDAYILALKKHHGGGGLFESTKFILRSDASKFLIRDGSFIRGSKKNPMQEGKLSDLYVAIRAIREQRSIKNIAREADIIARGTVTGISEENDAPSGEDDTKFHYVKLRIHSWIKGRIEGDVLTVGMIKEGLYRPPWRTKVPDMHEGEEWYVFAKWNDEIGYYPFAGVNGLFRIEGDRIIRDNLNTIYLTFDPEGFEKEISTSIQKGW
jgi:hypothetical protein